MTGRIPEIVESLNNTRSTIKVPRRGPPPLREKSWTVYNLFNTVLIVSTNLSKQY